MFYKTRMLSRMLAVTNNKTAIPADIEHTSYMYGKHFGMKAKEAAAFGTALMFLTGHIRREDIADIFRIDLHNGLIMFNNGMKFYLEDMLNILSTAMDAQQVEKAAQIAETEANEERHFV